MSGIELFLILVFAFIIFGPDKLPAIAKTAGKAISKFQDAQREVESVVKKEIDTATEDTGSKSTVNVKKADSGTAAAGAAAAGAAAEGGEAPKRTETFAERRARYEKERAEREAAAVAEQRKNVAAGAANADEAKPAEPSAAAAETSGAAKPAEPAAAEPEPEASQAAAEPEPEPVKAAEPAVEAAPAEAPSTGEGE